MSSVGVGERANQSVDSPVDQSINPRCLTAAVVDAGQDINPLGQCDSGLEGTPANATSCALERYRPNFAALPDRNSHTFGSHNVDLEERENTSTLETPGDVLIP